jgi:hypothetical protein
MVFFIFLLVFMFAFSGALYLMVRALPRVAEADPTEASGEYRSILDRWAHSDIPERIDATFNSWLLKFLRKFKVVTLRLDNALSTHLHKIRAEHEVHTKKAAIDFKEISGQNKESEEAEL